MAEILDQTELHKLSDDRIKHGPFTFVRALTIKTRKPLIVTPAELRTGEPLYALPGGGRATKEYILRALKAAA